MDKKVYLSVMAALATAVAIRPLAIGAKRNIPVPVIVLGAISGVFALGILGLILGPVLVAVFVTVWREATDVDQRMTPDAEHTEPVG